MSGTSRARLSVHNVFCFVGHRSSACRHGGVIDSKHRRWGNRSIASLCRARCVYIFSLSNGLREECPDSMDFHNKARIHLCRSLGFLYPAMDQNKPCLPLWGGWQLFAMRVNRVWNGGYFCFFFNWVIIGYLTFLILLIRTSQQ